MKKILITLLVLTILFIASNYESTEVIIPKDSIRFRVVASTNKEEDQKNKKIIANNLKQDITTILKNSNSLEDSRNTLKIKQ